jgi:hypothetical protein
MSIAPPQLKPSFKFLLNAQRPIVNNSSSFDLKPKICSASTSNSTPSLLIAAAKIAVFTMSCILIHVYSPAKMPALLALVIYYESSSFPTEREAACAAVLMLLMRPSETILSWTATIIWLIPHIPLFVSPLCAMLILCFPSPTPASAITYALSIVRGLIYVATKRKCAVVLFSPSIPVLMFATCALILLDDNKRLSSRLKSVTEGYFAMQPSPGDDLSVIVEENSETHDVAATDITSKNSSPAKFQ